MIKKKKKKKGCFSTLVGSTTPAATISAASVEVGYGVEILRNNKKIRDFPSCETELSGARRNIRGTKVRPWQWRSGSPSLSF